MTINVKKIVLSLALLVSLTPIKTFCMAQTMQNFDILTTFQDNKAAILAGIGFLGSAVLGYTTYSFWQKNNALKQQLNQHNQLQSPQQQPGQVVNNGVSNNLQIELLKAKINLLKRTRKAQYDSLKENFEKYKENNKELQEFTSKLIRTSEESEINLALANQIIQEITQKFQHEQEARKAISVEIEVHNQHQREQRASQVKEERKQAKKQAKIPFIRNILDQEEKRKALEKEFEELVVSEGDGQDTILFESNTKEKEKNESMRQVIESTMPLDTSVFEVTQGEQVTDETENFKFYSFKPIHIKYSKSQTEDPIVLVAVHGTFVDDAEYGGDLQEGITQDIIQYGKYLARDQKANIIILPYRWSGKLSEFDRNEAGNVLAKHIKEKCHAGQRIFAITHSHGGNVLLEAAKELEDWGPIEEAYAIAPPIADILPKERVKSSSRVISYTDTDLNICNFYCIYSTSDITQGMGSNHSTSWVPLLGGNFERRINFIMSKDCKVWNIRVQDQGFELNHLSIIRPVLQNLTKLIPVVRYYYAHVHDLDANFSANYELPQVAIRNWVRSPGCKNSELEQALIYSDRASQQFEEEYGRNIKDKVSYTVVNIISEAKDAISNVAGRLATKIFSWENFTGLFTRN
jgi:hypothetical protein